MSFEFQCFDTTTSRSPTQTFFGLRGTLMGQPGIAGWRHGTYCNSMLSKVVKEKASAKATRHCLAGTNNGLHCTLQSSKAGCRYETYRNTVPSLLQISNLHYGVFQENSNGFEAHSLSASVARPPGTSPCGG